MPIVVDPLPNEGATEIVLDPSEVATGRVELALNVDAIRIMPPGPDWGEALIEQYLAEQSRGQVPVDYRVPNRQIMIPLLLGADGPAGFAGAKAQLQAKVAMFQREGGWLRRGDGLYADITNAGLKLPDHYGHLGVEADVILTLEALPDFYGDEIELSDNVETSAAELVFTHAGIQGDYPARVRIVVDEDDGERQLGLLWGVRCRHYSANATAALAYEAEDLTPLDAATVQALTGASGGDVVKHANLSTSWTPVLATKLLAGGELTHTGTYRVWARVHTTAVVPPRVRLVWDVGDIVLPEENTPQRPPGASQFYPLDLGEIRLDPGVGAHRWLGQVHAAGDTGGEDISIDKLWLVPVDEGYVVLRAPAAASVEGLANYVARDEFNQTTGALHGKTLPIGGNWATSGDADDFTIDTALKAAKRVAVSDADLDTGRLALAGTTLHTDVELDADLSIGQTTAATLRIGLVARYVDANNWLMAVFETATAPWGTLKLLARVAGSTGTLGSVTVPNPYSTTGLRLNLVGGDYSVLTRAGGTWEEQLAGQSQYLLAGGALETGKIGVYDAYTSATPSTRAFYNFSAREPVLDAVLFPNQSAELRHDGVYREDSTGTAYGPVSHRTGSLPRLPPSGLENRPVEVFLKASRGDFDTRPDAGIDDISAQVFYRPSWLFAPA